MKLLILCAVVSMLLCARVEGAVMIFQKWSSIVLPPYFQKVRKY
jgi:hypothetical protein